MTKKNNTKIEVQYFLFLYTDESQTLIADRRKGDNAILEVCVDENSESIDFLFTGLRIEAQRKKTPKIHTDIYILVGNAKLLLTELEFIKDNVIGATDLDRQIREAKDPTFTYDNSRVPLLIDKNIGYFKVSRIGAVLGGLSKLLVWQRSRSSDLEPSFNVDIEHNNTRLHFGSSAVWDDVEEVSGQDNSFLIKIPFSEFGQLYSLIKSSLRGL